MSATNETQDTDAKTLGEQYLAAMADRSVPADEYTARLARIERTIFRACGSEAAGWRFITGITNDNDHAVDLDHARRELQAAYDAADKGINGIAAALVRLGENELCDVEIAEGDTDAMDAALVALRLNLAALRHLTKNATPEPRP